MEASEMLDVIHYYFEEDSHYISEIQAETRSSLRESVYRDMYGRELRHLVKFGGKKSSSDSEDDDELLPFSTDRDQVKPFIPATDFEDDSIDPFGGLLDTPLR
jgi:hypothetical protein